MQFFKQKMVLMFALVTSALFCLKTSADFYPTQGDLYYNGKYYMNSFFRWGAPVWSVSNPGYEHDLWIHNSRYFTSSCTTMSNLPDGYDDCLTAGVGDAQGPVFSFGTYSANNISADTWYFGAWSWSTRDTSMASTGFSLLAQENKNICGGIKSILCMKSTQTRNLISGYSMNWLGIPSWIVF